MIFSDIFALLYAVNLVSFRFSLLGPPRHEFYFTVPACLPACLHVFVFVRVHVYACEAA